MAWFVYMVQCSDNSLYTGITTDVTRRVAEHNGDTKAPGAKYTAARRPVRLVYQEDAADKSAASKREHYLRTRTRSEKEQLCVQYKNT